MRRRSLPGQGAVRSGTSLTFRSEALYLIRFETAERTVWPRRSSLASRCSRMPESTRPRRSSARQNSRSLGLPATAFEIQRSWSSRHQATVPSVRGDSYVLSRALLQRWVPWMTKRQEARMAVVGGLGRDSLGLAEGHSLSRGPRVTCALSSSPVVRRCPSPRELRAQRCDDERGCDPLVPGVRHRNEHQRVLGGGIDHRGDPLSVWCGDLQIGVVRPVQAGFEHKPESP